MGLNRYSALPDQKIISTHVAQDLTLANAALASKQKAYNEAELYDETVKDSLSKFATRDVDVARKNQLVKDYQDKALAVVDQYGGDYSQAMPALKKLANASSQDEYWQRATSSLSRQKDFYAAQKRIAEKGGTAIEFNDDAVRKAVYNKDGTFNNIDYDIQERGNRPEAMRKYYDHMKGDKFSGGLSGSGVAGLLKTGSIEGIGDKRIRDVMQTGIASYIQGTPEGMQHFKEYTQLNKMSTQQAYGKIAQEMLGVGEQYKYQQSDANYISDPSYDKAGSEKDDSVTVLDTTSPAVNVNNPSGVTQDLWTRKNRLDAKRLLSHAAAAAGSDQGANMYAPGGLTKGASGANNYGDLSQDQRNKSADMIARIFPVYAEKLRKGTISQKGLDEIAPTIRKQLKALSNLKVGAKVKGVDPDQDYGSFGKGEEGLTKALLGGDNLSNIVSGKLINTIVYDPETGEKMSGKDFNTKILVPAQAEAKAGKQDATARITGRFGAANPYSLLTNDDSFGDAKQLTIGGKQYVVAGLDETQIHRVSSKQKDGTVVKGTYNDKLSEKQKQKASPITKAMRNVGQNTTVTLGDAKFKLRWNPDGTFTFPQQVGLDGKMGHTTDDPEAVIDAYLKKQQQNKHAR